MTEYFLLAVAVSFPFYVYGLRGFPLMLVAGLICVAFACGDEYHQSFVEGRGPSVKDVCIDSIGAFGGNPDRPADLLAFPDSRPRSKASGSLCLPENGSKTARPERTPPQILNSI